ncbi:MAG: hypothetical protein QM831_25120 [Kofleriaceae bacterium]
MTTVELEVSGEGDTAALHDAIWELVQSWVDMYTAGDANRFASEYLPEAIDSAVEDERWGVDGSTLRWTFDDFGGRRSHTASVWAHWTTRALASEWDRVAEAADEHEHELVSEPPTRTDPHLISMRGSLWFVDETGLVTDGKSIPVAELDADERARYDIARDRCMCGPCMMTRPEPAFEQGMIEALTEADSASSAAWYIQRWPQPSQAVLFAMIHAAGSDVLRFAIEHVAALVPDAAATVSSLMATLIGLPRARALYALSSMPLDDDQRALLIREVTASLDGDDATTEAAAEVAGLQRGADPELYERVAAILDRDVSEELRHQAVLGLSNAHFDRPPSAKVRAVLEREAKRDTEAGQLAKWFLSSFHTKL